MNEILEKENIEIKNLIYEIRGKQVMLDSDLAQLYRVETKRINEAIKNNPKKFPERYAFRITESEYASLKSNFSTSKGGSRKGHTALTEQGIAMLTTILKSDIAIEMSIRIMDTFVAMKHYLLDNNSIYKSITHINNKLNEYDDKFDYLFSKFDKKEQLFFKGETFDAYFNILDILNTAKDEIIIIDNYADVTFLDLIKNIKCNAILITRDCNRLSDIEIEKYNKQYNNLRVIRDNSYHDRYFIIDKKDIYLSGTSINSIGDKTFMIIKLEDKFIKEMVLNNINNII